MKTTLFVTATPAEALFYRIADCMDDFTLTGLVLQIPHVAGYGTEAESELIQLAAAKQIELGERSKLARN